VSASLPKTFTISTVVTASVDASSTGRAAEPVRGRAPRPPRQGRGLVQPATGPLINARNTRPGLGCRMIRLALTPARDIYSIESQTLLLRESLTSGS
jgi:hypothetical protein